MVNAATRALALGLAILGVLTLSACYESATEIIPASLAETIPYRGSQIAWADGTRTALAPVPFSKDYRFQQIRPDETKSGTFRALRVARDIFAVQARFDGDATYNILFYRITATRVDGVEAATPDVQRLATRTGVSFDDDPLGTKIAGRAADLLAFVRAHGQLAFHDATP